MLKVGDILWMFCGNDYFVGEISDLAVVSIGFSKKEAIDYLKEGDK